jgi:hypothetical protein
MTDPARQIFSRKLVADLFRISAKHRRNVQFLPRKICA